MVNKKNKTSLRQQFIQVLLFIFVGIPGLLMFLYSSFYFLVCINNDYVLIDNWKTLVLSILMLPVGGYALLAGTGKLKQKRYIYVFLSFPIATVLFWFLFISLGIGSSKGFEPIFAAGVLTAIVNVRVSASYKDNHSDDNEKS